MIAVMSVLPDQARARRRQMISVSMSEARRNLYKLIELVRAGETVIITFGRSKTPVVKIVPFEPDA
jgi:prevent-host-death family protein